MATVALSVFSIPPLGAPHVLIRFLGQWDGILTHFKDKRPHACPGESCRIHHYQQTWKGYAAGQVHNPGKQRWDPFALEVTIGMLECLGLGDLRGTCWECFREEHKWGKRQITALHRETYPLDTLQRPFDITRPVELVFGTKEILWGVDPQPWMKSVAETSDDPAPVILREEKVKPQLAGPEDWQRFEKAHERMKGPTNGKKT